MGTYFSFSGKDDAGSADPAAKQQKKGVVSDKKAAIRYNLTRRALGTIAMVFAVAGCTGLVSYFMGGIASFIIAFIAPLLSAVLVMTCCVMVPVCLTPDLWKQYPWNVLLLTAVTFVQGSLCFLMAGYSRSLAVPVGFIGAALSCGFVSVLGVCVEWQPGLLNSIAIGTLPSVGLGALMFIDPGVTVLSAVTGAVVGCLLGVWALVRVRTYVGGPADPIPQPGGDSANLTLVLLIFTEAFTATVCNPLRWYGADKMFSKEQKARAAAAQHGAEQAAAFAVAGAADRLGSEKAAKGGLDGEEAKGKGGGGAADDAVFVGSSSSGPGPAAAPVGAGAEESKSGEGGDGEAQAQESV